MLKKWYSGDDKMARILTTWKTMTLSKSMAVDPKESEVNVFRKSVPKLCSLQNQLDTTYQTEILLWDRLLTAVDIQSIQATTRDHTPDTSQQAVNRVANQLCNKKNPTGSNSAFTVDFETEEEEN